MGIQTKKIGFFWVLLLGFASSGWAETSTNPVKESDKSSNGRYQLFSPNGGNGSLVILLDSQTGMSWRNVRCGQADTGFSPPNCWQLMEGANK